MSARMMTAYIFYYVGFVGFAAYVLISYATRNKAAVYIFARDLEVNGKIIPCRFSWMRELLGFTLLACVVIGLSIGWEEYTSLLFVAIIYLLLGIFIFKDACKYLVLNDEHISITVFQKNIQYLRSDIRIIEWKNSRGITGKQLSITFSDGKSYCFDMDHYRGVQNTYNALID